jgi:hypothetical protein
MPNGDKSRKDLANQELRGDTRDASANDMALPTTLRWQGENGRCAARRML